MAFASLLGFLVPFLALSQHCYDGTSHLQTHKVSIHGGVDGQVSLDSSLADPNEYYECTDFSECTLNTVENVGAACCSGDNTCMTSTISLAAGGTCTHDVCCSGINSCSPKGDPTVLTGVSSLSCNGNSACVDVDTTLSQDLFCTGNFACHEGTFNFGAGEQCIVCSDDSSCREATFNVASSGDVTNALCTGEAACRESVWTIASEKSMRLYCKDTNSCRSMRVTLQSEAALRLFCDGFPACRSTTIIKESQAKCQCTELNGGQCPDECGDSVSIDPPTRCVAGEDTACCAGEGQCADCGCVQTTTLTTTVGPDPNEYYECTKESDCTNVTVQHVGAACCSGDSTCVSSTISLAAGGTCTHDVCCSGINSCSPKGADPTVLTGVSSLSCNGQNACADVDTTLSQDLFCTGNSACFLATFNFEAGEQCIVCSDDSSCQEATFRVASSGDVTNALCKGDSACRESVWTIASGKSMRIYCEGQSSCHSMRVRLQKEATMKLFCDGVSSCQSTTIIKQKDARCQCTELNGGQCPDECSDSVSIDPPTRCVAGEDTACCAGEGQCADCGCGETTTLTTTVGPDPNEYYECTKESDCNEVTIENVGAACCSGDKTCKDSTISLAAGGTCTHDVCCSGSSSCSASSGADPGETTLAGVSSLSCNGNSACGGVNATLSQDLFCTGNSACFGATFNFEAGEQCIVCSDNSCRQATFNVAISGDVTNALCTGDSACRASVWNVASGKSMRLYCEDESSCKLISVTLQSEATLRLFCDGVSACQDSQIIKQSQAKCECTERSGGQCPEGCDDSVSIDPPTRCVAGEDTACCAGEGQCADCGCGESTTLTTSGGAVGDPHMDTLDGKHYILLREGTFSLWHLRGADAEVGAGHGQKKMFVDFQIYAHYSGHTSYTKGLLLLDASGGKGTRMALEMTSQDCRWRSKTQGAWKAVNGPQFLSLPDVDGDNMTAFKVVESGANTHIELLMKQIRGSFTNVGNLIVRCKPGHFLNVKMSMPQQDVHLVEGQLGPREEGNHGKLSASSFVQGTQEVGRGDQEFETSKNWEDLGGSSVAASYLRMVDGQGVALLESCSKGEEETARVECAKYLGKPSTSGSSQFATAFASCVYDVCHGGGEIAAQLAAEIWNAK